MRYPTMSARVPASPFGSVDLWETLDAVVLAIVEFVDAAGVPLCALEDATTGYLEELLRAEHDLLPVEIHWSGQTSAEGGTVVWVQRDIVERLVVVCRVLGAANSWGAEAECPLTVWNLSGPGLLVLWLNQRICALRAIHSRRPHFHFQGAGEPAASALAVLVRQVYAMVFLDDPDLWDGVGFDQ